MKAISKFLYIMDKAIHLPLGIHFTFSSQSEFIHAFVHRDIAKHRFNHPQPFTVLSSANAAVDLYSHFIRIR